MSKAAFQRVIFLRGELHLLPEIPDRFRRGPEQRRRLGHVPLCLGQFPAPGGGPAQVPFRILCQGQGVLLPGIQGRIGPLHGLGELPGVAQAFPPGGELRFLPWPEPGLGEILNGLLEALGQPLFLRLVQFQAADLLPGLPKGVPGRGIGRPHRFRNAEAVQILQVPFLVQELAAVVLAVDVQEQRAQLPELGGGDRRAVHPAQALPLRRDAPEQQQLPLLVLHAVFRLPAFRPRGVEHRGDEAALRSGAHQLPAGHRLMLPENEAEAVFAFVDFWNMHGGSFRLLV